MVTEEDELFSQLISLLFALESPGENESGLFVCD